MSGGSMDYFYAKVLNIEFPLTSPERVAFKDLLTKVSKALHDIEWVDSGDYMEGDEINTILECLNFDPNELFINEAIKYLKIVLDQTNREVKLHIELGELRNKSIN